MEEEPVDYYLAILTEPRDRDNCNKCHNGFACVPYGICNPCYRDICKRFDPVHNPPHGLFHAYNSYGMANSKLEGETVGGVPVAVAIGPGQSWPLHILENKYAKNHRQDLYFGGKAYKIRMAQLQHYGRTREEAKEALSVDPKYVEKYGRLWKMIANAEEEEYRAVQAQGDGSRESEVGDETGDRPESCTAESSSSWAEAPVVESIEDEENELAASSSEARQDTSSGKKRARED